MKDPITRVALITGCGKPDGIGSVTARAIAKTGVPVVVTDVEPSGVANDLDVRSATTRGGDGLEGLVDEIVSSGGRAAWVLGDVSVEADANRVVRYALEAFGRLDILVNNAAAAHGDDRADIEAVPLSAWERVMSINARGVFLMCRAALAPMKRQRWGRIVNLSSAVVKFPRRDRAVYSASKAAVVGFTEALAVDVAASGITVNAVCPGSIRTGRAISTTRKMVGSENIEDGMAARARSIPVGRHGEPQDVANIIAFLASDAGAYVTGQVIFVDGGGLPIG